MTKRTKDPSDRLIAAAMREADDDAIAIAEATGTPVIIWENGAVREVDPKEMRRRLEAKAKPKKKAPPRSSAKKRLRKTG